MKPAVILLTVAAFATMAAAIIARRLAPGFEYLTADPADAATVTDELQALASEAQAAIMGTPAQGMEPSAELLAMLKRGEALSLTAYRLGDGGATIGYGRFYRDGTNAPAAIDRDTAERWFLEDVEARGARWVRAYVSAPLTQTQFDALVSMAYNLSPGAFRTIAQAVNEGADPESEALRYVRQGTNLEAGLRNRRAREIALFRAGIYG